MPLEYTAIYTSYLTEDLAKLIEQVCSQTSTSGNISRYKIHKMKASFIRTNDDQADFIAQYWFTNLDTATYLQLLDPAPDYIGLWDIKDIGILSNLNRTGERCERLYNAAYVLSDEIEMDKSDIAKLRIAPSIDLADRVAENIYDYISDNRDFVMREMAAAFSSRRA
jgi:hypothetical protein